MLSHKVGDRVTRHVDVFDVSSSLMHGTVVDATPENVKYPHDTKANDTMLYDVRWDDTDRIREDYFWWGIDPE